MDKRRRGKSRRRGGKDEEEEDKDEVSRIKEREGIRLLINDHGWEAAGGTARARKFLHGGVDGMACKGVQLARV